jgi:hypothetical protein
LIINFVVFTPLFKPLYLFKQSLGFCLLIVFGACLFSTPDLFSKSASDKRREAYYENLEARARSLSQKLAEISGTEPIPFQRPQASVLSTMESSAQGSNPQTAFDSLPGQVVEQKKIEPVGENETLYRADGTPVILQNAPTTSPAIASTTSPKKRAIRRNMEKERGSYFVQPFIGITLPSSGIKYSGFNDPSEIESKAGNNIGISVGRRWDNLEGEIHFGYVNTDFSKLTSPSFTPHSTDGQLEIFHIGTRLGYGIPFGEGGWFRVAGGFGFGNRRDVLNVELVQGDPIASFVSSETSFTYDLLLGLGYEVGLGLDAFLAYRLLGVSENGDFDSVAMHLFQLGLGANF